MPKFLRRYTHSLQNAPVTHITAFLILHELTAVVPLFGLVAAFHYTDWVPTFVSEGRLVAEGVKKFTNYFRKKGWLGDDDSFRNTWWTRSEGGRQIVVEYVQIQRPRTTLRN